MPVTKIKSRWDSGNLIFHESSTLATIGDLIKIETGIVTIGSATNDVDFKIFLGGTNNYALFDCGSSAITFALVDVALSGDLAVSVEDISLEDDCDLEFGDGTDALVRWSTADDDNHALVIALGNSNQGLHITDKAAVATDWNIAATTHPCLYIHSNTTPATDYLMLGDHNGTTAYIDVVGGTTLSIDIAGTPEVCITASATYPATDDSNALGITSTNEWSDLFLAAEAVIGWNNSNCAITHAAGILTVTGDVSASNAAGFTLQDEAATATNPTLCPNKAEVDTGFGWISTDIISVILGGVSEFTFQATTLDCNANTITDVGDILCTDAAGPTIQNEAATLTNPTLIPNRADETTGIGWNTAVLSFVISGASEVALSATALYPGTDNGSALGVQDTNEWADLFLASGGIIGWNNNDVTITHSANLLTLGGGGLSVGADGAGFDVILYGERTGSDFFWDQDGQTNGSLNLGTTTVSEGVDLFVHGDTASNYLHWDCSADDLMIIGTAARVLHGADGAGNDVIFYGAVANYAVTWDADGDTNGQWEFGADTYGVSVLFRSSNAARIVTWDPDGDTDGSWSFGADTEGLMVNLYGDVTGCGVFWDPSTDTNGTLTIGGSGGSKGNDVVIYGDTNGAYLQWDQSADDLLLVGAGLYFSGTQADEVIKIGGTYDHGIFFTEDPQGGDVTNSFINVGDYTTAIAVAPTSANMFGVMHNVTMAVNVAYWYQAYYTKITTSGTTTDTSVAGHALRMQIGSSLGAVYGIQCHTNITATNTCANEIISVSAYVDLAAGTVTTTDRVCALQAMINGSGTAGTVTGDVFVAYIANAGTVVTTDSIVNIRNQSAATAVSAIELELDGTITYAVDFQGTVSDGWTSGDGAVVQADEYVKIPVRVAGVTPTLYILAAETWA